ncbi:alpha/beta fold hydrolase [Nocardioides sp. P5_C9_2]
MIPSITAVRLTGARNRTELPLLVLGPSLGTSATTLWTACAAELTDAFDLLAWDLPGHGHNRTVPDEPFTMAELAEGVLRVVDDVLAERGEAGARFLYAGDSVGGAVGLQLLLDRPERVAAAALLGTGARIGDEATWSGCIGQLQEADEEGYVQVCAALASFDVRDRLSEIGDGVGDGTYAELSGVAHLAPAEAPAEVATLLRRHFLGEEPEGAADLARELQEFVTEYARGGGIWTRPGLDRRSRYLITLTALVARGHHEELALQVLAARSNGVTTEEITELILQTALYCGVPDATTAFRIAQRALAEVEGPKGAGVGGG